jgi:hypothetical protein
MAAIWRPGEIELPAARRGESDRFLLYASMALLLISTTQETGAVGDVIKVVWLVSVALLTVVNVGAAFGVYIAAVALFAVWSFGGWGAVTDRPDNYALLILIAGLVLRMVLARGRLWTWSTLVMGGFVAYGLLDTAAMGLLTRYTFAWYMRTFGLPMLMFLLLAQHGFGLREFRALVRSLLVLGAYMALVSIAERVGWDSLIVPAWITTPSLDTTSPVLSATLYPGRSGGILMQPAWNGLALSLIYCVAILSARLFNGRSRWVAGVVSLLCLVAIFLSYTRATWLACAFSSLVLLWRPAATRATTRLKRFGVAAASAALVVTLALLPDTTARQRIGDSGTVLFRLNLWEAAVGMVADRPLWGAGFGSFGGNLADYQQDMTVGAPTNFTATPSHNTELNVLVELGLIGIVLYLGALVAMLRRARAAALQFWGREGGVWVAVFFGVYVIQAQFAFAHEPTTNQIFFGMMGAVAGLLRRDPTLRRDPAVRRARVSETPIFSNRVNVLRRRHPSLASMIQVKG